MFPSKASSGIGKSNRYLCLLNAKPSTDHGAGKPPGPELLFLTQTAWDECKALVFTNI